MWSLMRGEPAFVVRFAAPLILLGMLMGFVCANLELPGVITSVYAIALGASGGSLVRWQTDRGLWMLAGVFLLLFISIYGLIIIGQVSDLLRGAPQPDVGLVLDFTIATVLLCANLRFLFRVARFNWALSQQPHDR